MSIKLVAEIPRGDRMSSWSRTGSTDPVRTAVRFPMVLAIRIKTEEGEIEAVTENISANGILFSCEHPPAVDSRIEFTMNLPGAIMGSESDVTAHCTGRVVRHQTKGGLKQAAAIIDEYFLKA